MQAQTEGSRGADCGGWPPLPPSLASSCLRLPPLGGKTRQAQASSGRHIKTAKAIPICPILFLLHLHISITTINHRFFVLLTKSISASPSTAMGRNTVKKQILIDTGRKVTTLVTEVRRRRADKMAPHRTTSVVTGQSQANAVVDECLAVVDGLPSARRKNPTAAILPQVDMTNAIEHKGSILYEKHKGWWVAEFISESNTESVTQ